MDDMRVGAAFRAVRLRRGWRQSDVADRAGVSQSLVSLVERGHLDRISLSRLRAIGRVLEIRIDLYARWRGGSLDRMLGLRHSLLAESVVAHFARWPGWLVVPEVSFSIYGERGVIDLLAFHGPSRSLLVIELKTAIIDVGETIGTLDRKARLAPRIARERGWAASSVSSWLIVARDKTSLRRIEAHHAVLRAALPVDGRSMRSWLAHPCDQVRALSTWSLTNGDGASPLGAQRVRPGGARSRIG